MKLSEALTRLSNKKGQISRVESYINESITYYPDSPPDYKYLEELKKRELLQEEIDSLKESIQLTNANTKVKEYDISLAGVLLKNARLRGDIAFYQRILAIKIEYDTSFTARTKDTITKVFADGYDKSAIRKKIEELESEKEKIDEVIKQTNLITNLIE